MAEESLERQKDEEICRISETEAKLSKQDADTDIDMITQLPDPILQHILLFLPIADAARMSTVSKSWLNIWNSLSVLQFSFHRESPRNSLTKNDQSLEKFMAWVDDSLSTLRSQEGKPIIHSFVLDLNLVQQRHPFGINGMNNMKIIAYIDDWISLVLKNCVKHIKLSISNIIYTLPPLIFSAKSFLTLHIEGCSIRRESSFPMDHAPFNCLKELALLRVDASSCSIEKILSFSPLLEKVTLKEIGQMVSLKICNLPSLSYLEVDQTLEDSLEIEAPNLRTLILQLNGSVKVYVSDCFKVKGAWFGNYHETKLVIEHPTLETLQLSFYTCTRVRVVCAHLTTISLSNNGYERPLEVEIVDTPTLEQFNYEGYVVPSFRGMASHVKPSAKLNLFLGGRPGLDVAVRSFIDMFNQPIVHLTYLYGQFFKAQEFLWPGQVQEVEVDSPPPKVKCLTWNLGSLTPAFAYPYLLDGSLCSCHPGILIVEAVPDNREFIKFLCHELLNREDNPTCCKDEPGFKCWRHYLKHVAIEIQDLSGNEKPKPSLGSDLVEILQHIDTSEEFQFSMEWSTNLI